MVVSPVQVEVACLAAWVATGGQWTGFGAVASLR